MKANKTFSVWVTSNEQTSRSMRSIYSKALMILCLFAGGMAATAQPVLLLHATNTQWRYFYQPSANDPDPFGGSMDWKDVLYGDGSWSVGTGLFGHEDGSNFPVYHDGLRFGTYVPPPATNGSTGPINSFFRAHFNWNSTTQGVLLSFTNYIDDGHAVFLNGVEIIRHNIPGNRGEAIPYNTQASAANPGGDGQAVYTFTVDPAELGATLVQGDNVIAVLLAQNGTGSSDDVFGMFLYGSQCIPATVQHPPVGGTNITVEECRTLTMTVQASGLPNPSYNWLHLGNPIGVTTASLTVTNVRPGVNDGAYTVEVTNLCGTVLSGAFNVTITPDNTPPTMVKAVVDPTRSQVTVSFSEPLADPADGDQFNIVVAPTSNPNDWKNDFGVIPVRQNGTNLVITLAPGAWIEGTDYGVYDQGNGARDACNANQSAIANIPIDVPLVVRQGLNGYADALDIEIHMNTDASATLQDTPNATAVSVSVDQQDGTLGGVNSASVALLRFGNLFGNGPTQIPVNATITSAILTIDQNDPGSAANAHRMLIDWDANSTWNSLNNGVSTDGVEATATADFSIPNAANAFRNFNVLSSLQAWQSGQPNYGWVFLSTGTDGWDWSSSDAAEADRPTLTVQFTRPPDTTLTPGPNPSSPVSAQERGSFSISWTVGGDGGEFQWQRQIAGVYQDIPGAVGSTYTDSTALPSESGNYRVYACNSINCVTSSVVVVNVTPDTERPTIQLVTVGQDRTTLVLRYSEPVTSAGTFSISPNVGVTSATLGGDNQTVTVVTGPRTWRTSYTLNVSGTQDTAETPNTITTTNVVFEQDSMIITGFFEDWKYETNNLDGAAWTSPDPGTFDDALWFVGPGIFGFEPSGAGSNTLRNAGLTLEANGYQPATRWDVNANQPTYYVRKVVNVTGPIPADTVFEMQHYVDDGAIAYVNGTEAWRMGFTNGQTVAFATYSAGAPVGGEATIQTNTLPLVAGNNLVAVEIHQQNAGSSDVVFAARIVAVHRLIAPTLTITQSGLNVTVSWTPNVGTLQESTDLVNWSTSLRVNGVPAPATGNRFFRVVR